jgi:spectinomycin phosphotransferase
MIEKPGLSDETIAGRLAESYGLQVARLAFLPGGADLEADAYHVVADDGREYFLKTRGDRFAESSVALPRLFADLGVKHIIAPLPANTGQLWADLDGARLILYPFVPGRNAYEADLAHGHWIELGATLRQIHSVTIPEAIAGLLRQEDYSPEGREAVLSFLEMAGSGRFQEPVPAKLAGFLESNSDEIVALVARTTRLAHGLSGRAARLSLCHNDLHAGNILIAGDDFYLVDWDEVILAPRERDLMYAGGGLIGRWRDPEEEEALFYQGYGPTEVDPAALAYYRYERIIQDIAVECKHIFLSTDSREAKERSYKSLISNFEIGNVLEIAYNAERKATNRYP